MKQIFIIMILFSFIPMSVFAKKEKDKKEPPHQYSVSMNDGTTIEGVLSQDWVRWPAKSVNVDFKIKTAGGEERKITVNEIDTIYDLTNGEKFVAANLLSPRIGKTGRTVKWISKCGQKSSHGEILSYVAWFNFLQGSRSSWDLGTVHCIRFENDSVAYPFHYPPQNGEYNVSVMKKQLKTIRPDAVEFIDRYFKSNKAEKKKLAEQPELFLNVYEDYLKSLSQ